MRGGKLKRSDALAAAFGYREGTAGLESAARSAEVVVPLLFERFAPRRVLDVGCGAGDWLRACFDCGAKEVLGLDAEWVPESSLRIPPSCVLRTNLNKTLPDCGKFDLVLCLEVAEHLEPAAGEALIDWLRARTEVVVWSAAIPGQGGHEHINERYQAEWIHAFAARGLEAFDLIRPKIWMDARVSWWYQQNLLVFASAEGMKEFSLTPQAFAASIVHPVLLERALDPRRYSLRSVAAHLHVYAFDRLKLLLKRLRRTGD